VSSFYDLPGRWASNRIAVQAIASNDTRRSLQEASLTAMRRHSPPWLNEIRVPSSASVDVMPIDLGVFYADPELRWDPRPVSQSYDTYTPWLDSLDADFLSGPRAPEYIVYSLEAID